MTVLSFLLTGMLCACGRSTEEERREVPENVKTGAGLTAEAVAGGESEAVAGEERPPRRRSGVRLLHLYV